MKKALIIILFLPTIVLGQIKNDSILIEQNLKNIKALNKNFSELQEKYDYQLKVNDQTLNSISNQIGATSFNLSIFAFLFGILAIGLGIYVTWVERKIVKLRDENEKLLKQTKDTKDEVVAINELIQKDIYGLFLKIKREETTHILNRLVKIPEDISNLSQELLSRELKQEDFSLLKKAYLKLKSKPKKEPKPGFITLSGSYDTSYLLLFFQHFLDLSLKDEEISSDLTDYFANAIDCAFENDIIKSTEDFTKALIDLGYQTKEKEINSFLKGISNSDFKNLDKIYRLFFESLKIRDDRFKFYELFDETNEIRIAKINYGKLLISKYGNTDLSKSESDIIENIGTTEKEVIKEEEEKRLAEEKRKEQEAERKRKREEQLNKNKK
jgi:hypothetical protein